MINNYSGYLAAKQKNKLISEEDKSGEKYYSYLSYMGAPPPAVTPEQGTDDQNGTGAARIPTEQEIKNAKGAVTNSAGQTMASIAGKGTGSGNGGAYAGYLRPQSASAWRDANGLDTQGAYDRAIRQSETDYLKSQATYGQKAEQLGQAGLSGSGYGEYITGVGFASMQNSKVSAAEQKAANDISVANAYSQYVQGVGQANAQITAQRQAEEAKAASDKATADKTAKEVKDTITNMAAASYSPEDVKKYIMNYYGIDEATATQYMNGIYDVGAKQAATNQEAVSGETSEQQYKINQSALSASESGYTANQIYQQLISSGASDVEAQEAINQLQANMAVTVTDSINTAASVDSIPTSEQIKQAVTTGNITQEQANSLTQAAQAKRAEMLMNKWDSVDDTNVTQFFADADALHKSGDISTADYIKLYNERFNANLQQSVIDGEPVAGAMKILSYLDTIKDTLGGDAYNALVGNITSRISVGSATVTKSKAGQAAQPTGIATATVKMSVAGTKGTEDVQLIIKKSGEVTASGTNGQITGQNGKLYVYSDGGWYEVMSVSASNIGGNENAAAMLNILKSKYGVADAIKSGTGGKF